MKREFKEMEVLHPLGREELIDHMAARGYMLTGPVGHKDGKEWLLFEKEDSNDP